MRRINKILFLLLIVLIIVLIIIGISVNKQQNNNNDEDKEINEINENYFDYYTDQWEIEEKYLVNVKLPDNYLEYDFTNYNSIEEILELIYEKTEVNVPSEIMETYKNEIYKNLQKSAENDETDLNEYISQNYGLNSAEEYIEQNEQYYILDIKKDMFYQALAKDLEISSIEEEDVKEYFANLLDEGESWEKIKENYGEKLMYKYTLEDKIENKIKEYIER
jgi:hypothetical protein